MPCGCCSALLMAVVATAVQPSMLRYKVDDVVVVVVSSQPLRQRRVLGIPSKKEQDLSPPLVAVQSWFRQPCGIFFDSSSFLLTLWVGLAIFL